MPQTYGVNIFLVHQIRISTMNVSSVMLGIETVFGRPYKKYPHFQIDSWILRVNIGWTDHINRKENMIQAQTKK